MPYCPNCGNEISAAAVACPNCGVATRPGGGTPAAVPAHYRRTEGSATAALVLGIAGLILCPLVCSILAIVFGNQAIRKIQADPNLDGEGMARAGIVLGWIGVGLVGLTIVFALIVSAGAGV